MTLGEVPKPPVRAPVKTSGTYQLGMRPRVAAQIRPLRRAMDDEKLCLGDNRRSEPS